MSVVDKKPALTLSLDQSPVLSPAQTVFYEETEEGEVVTTKVKSPQAVRVKYEFPGMNFSPETTDFNGIQYGTESPSACKFI